MPGLFLAIGVAVAAQAGALALQGILISWSAIAATALTTAIAYGLNYVLAENNRRGVAARDPGFLSQALTTVSTPARHAYGTCRTSGVLFFANRRPGNKATIDLAYAISEGNIAALDAVYLDGERVTFSRTNFNRTFSNGEVSLSQRLNGTEKFGGSVFTAVFYYGLITRNTIWHHGWSLRQAQPRLWSYRHLLPLCWIHIILYHNTQADTVFWKIPNPEFGIRGKLLSWPINGATKRPAPTFTNNIADVRGDYEESFNERKVDYQSWISARNVCGQKLQLTSRYAE